MCISNNSSTPFAQPFDVFSGVNVATLRGIPTTLHQFIKKYPKNIISFRFFKIPITMLMIRQEGLWNNENFIKYIKQIAMGMIFYMENQKSIIVYYLKQNSINQLLFSISWKIEVYFKNELPNCLNPGRFRDACKCGTGCLNPGLSCTIRDVWSLYVGHKYKEVSWFTENG